MADLGRNVDTAWDLAMKAIMKATKLDAQTVRAFLDSRQGRHFADQVGATGSLKTAIARATAQHMAWKISRRTAQDLDATHLIGAPYLTGMAMAAAVEAEI
jgi:hypothetical protein